MALGLITPVAAAAIIGFIGPGVYSVDAILGIEYLPWLTFLIALAVVILGVAISLLTAQYSGQSEQHQQSSQPH